MRPILPVTRRAFLQALLLLVPEAAALAAPVKFGRTGAPMRVYWLHRMLVVGVEPQRNEGYIQLARRVMAHPEDYAAIRHLNRDRPVRTGRPVVFPIATLKPELWSAALHAMYPDDELTEEGWAHTVTDPLESLIQLTQAYTGSRRYYRRLARLNGIRHPDLLRIGEQVVIPLRWIPDDLRIAPVAVAKPLQLEKDPHSGRRYAVYTVAPNDTLYSLVLRFTDRERAAEVTRMSRRLARLNRLRDDAHLLAGRRLRIPLEWLSDEFLVAPQVATEGIEPPAPAPPKRRFRVARSGQPFAPVHVIIDPGHGGVDPGAVYAPRHAPDHICEHEVVFDVATRLRSLLDARGFHTHMTVEDPHHHYPMPRLSMDNLGGEEVKVNPPYRMHSSDVSINMRVYLINALYRRLTEHEGVSPDRVVLLSIHGDALAPTLRGAMVYYPDHRLRVHEFDPRGHVYRIRAQAERGPIRFHPAECRAAEGDSRDFGEQLLASFHGRGLGVGHRKPARPFYYRHGKRTLPGVLRYSLVPTSVLVEVGNLNNRTERVAMLHGDTRQRVAHAFTDALARLRDARSGEVLARSTS